MEKQKQKLYKNNKFNISASTWNEEFALFDGWYSVSYIQDYFRNIFKKLRENRNKINENRI